MASITPATRLVGSEVAGCAVEAAPFEVAAERMDIGGVRLDGPAHRSFYAHDARRRHTADERDLFGAPDSLGRHYAP
jgi:hypothetical protein